MKVGDEVEVGRRVIKDRQGKDEKFNEKGVVRERKVSK
jgi:hypothetical protein